MSMFFVLCNSMNSKQKIIMYKIQFLPKGFNDIKGLSIYEPNDCTPELDVYNTKCSVLKISAPQTMTCFFKKLKQTEDVKVDPYLPICFNFLISGKRIYKYENKKEIALFIRKKSTTKWYSGTVEDKDPSSLIFVDEAGNEDIEFQKKVKEAQNYSDDELEDGSISGYAMNLNVIEYVDFPLEEGTYEIYLAQYNLESNHVFVDIVFEDE